MRVQFRTEGGIAAGLRRMLDIDTDEKTITIGIADRVIGTDDLPVEEANELERLMEVAAFFELPATSAPPAGAADHLRYTISVTTWDPSHKRRSHKAQLTDPIENRRVRELLGYLNRLWEKRVDARLASRRRDTS
jgi:Emfourin